MNLFLPLPAIFSVPAPGAHFTGKGKEIAARHGILFWTKIKKSLKLIRAQGNTRIPDPFAKTSISKRQGDRHAHL
jgi:hypothetical protein